MFWTLPFGFCKKLSDVPEEKVAGREYRLPTEAEWEYACRAGSKTAYCFGDTEESLTHYAWFGRNDGNKTHPVGKKKPNAWGLYDMHGNVWEWCMDRVGDYPSDAVTDPQGSQGGMNRVYRGGCWFAIAPNCRSAFRHPNAPSHRSNVLGFGLALGPIVK
jgi:formylglycine-generating enzyme required for sulfatase activity